MSSIYKKGRDGYFYYQAYVKNEKTGRKDKRVYQSLNTKDYDEALKKKVILDRKYDPIPSKISIKNLIMKNFKNVSLILGSSIITLQISEFLNERKNKVDIVDAPYVVAEKFEADSKLINEKKSILPTKSDTLLISSPINSTLNDNKDSLEYVYIESGDYNIERVKLLSKAFSQGEIHVSLNQNTSIKKQRIICKKIVKDYNQFANIVICLYKNTPEGIRVAQGIEPSNLEIEKESNVWLAMYTYNEVEGAYFDASPNRYKGFN